MTITHTLGFPRVGARRELKFAQEAYWKGESSQETLLQLARELRQRHWQQQAQAGIDLVPVNDFSLYDHVLDTSLLLGVIPERFGIADGHVGLDDYFRMARGRAPSGEPVAAQEMTKWFDTNYHYLVPELAPDQTFSIRSSKLFDEVDEAQALGLRAKPVLVGPLTFLWLSKFRGSQDAHDHADCCGAANCCGAAKLQDLAQDEGKLQLLPALLPVYNQILAKLAAQGVEWVQIDEPILSLELPQTWLDAFTRSYAGLDKSGVKVLLAAYFGELQSNLAVAAQLPFDGLHIDAVRGAAEVDAVFQAVPADRVISVGIVEGRNIWRNDLRASLTLLARLQARYPQQIWIGSSCSLLHVPVDLAQEESLNKDITSWLAFAVQKVGEIAVLRLGLDKGAEAIGAVLSAADAARHSRKTSALIHRADVKARLAASSEADATRHQPYDVRARAQAKRLQLPVLPTTTIGSFPQTPAIRKARLAFRKGELSEADYNAAMKAEIAGCVAAQEDYGLDMLVHGEAERNDMVEYFAEFLDGYAFTSYGWVQSYGSRCVKPPVIFGDVRRRVPMTVAWSSYAQSLTDKPMKGMLTGPVTMLKWAFVRDDQPLSETCLQIAYALRDEVVDLEKAGIAAIQIDEPAIKECLPLRKAEWSSCLQWAVRAFRISASGVQDDTQIHTHMCYSEFNDIIDSIAALDADVITIETSRSAMELLDAFVDFRYPNEIGPGVYDIHSPNVPSVEQMVALMHKAAEQIPVQRLWINPDCGLKTRGWPEVEASLRNMVTAARQLRTELA